MTRYSAALLRFMLALVAPMGCSALLGIEDAELIQGEGSGGAGGAPQDGDLCETYCDTVQANCTGELGVYMSRGICLALCGAMEPGKPGDTGVDTVHCRLGQAIAADSTGEPENHCPFAGLGTSGKCGANCDALCNAMLEFCTDEWASKTACMEDCNALDDQETFDNSLDSGGDVQCRLWHVGAATQSVVPHCSHAAGADPCVEADD